MVATVPEGSRIVIPVSLENELSCFPLPPSAACSRRPRPAPLMLGLVGAAPINNMQAQPAHRSVQIEILGAKLRVRVEGQLLPVPLVKLDNLLEDLLDKYDDAAITIYLNATASTSGRPS